MSTQKCDMDCFNCKYADCINSEEATYDERKVSSSLDNTIKSPTTAIDMTRYIRNRPDKEEYIKERNKEYEQKRLYKNTPIRKEQKRQVYLRHREEKLIYQKNYYQEHKEEVLARKKAHYLKNREEINRKRREKYRKERESCS